MINLYEKNGLLTRSEKDIQQRESFVRYVTNELKESLLKLNHSFTFHQCECPQLTPRILINEGYTEEDIYCLDDIALRPETTMGSYEYARHILNPHNDTKVKMPLVVRQHGKSFRREQDQVTTNMRLKEFHQLEFQIIYSATTSNDYYSIIVGDIQRVIERIGRCRIVESDRLPDYSEKTMDIEMEWNSMEVCSISQRKDFYTINQQKVKEYHKVVEVAIGTDRLLYNFYS